MMDEGRFFPPRPAHEVGFMLLSGAGYTGKRYGKKAITVFWREVKVTP